MEKEETKLLEKNHAVCLWAVSIELIISLPKATSGYRLDQLYYYRPTDAIQKKTR